MNRQLVALLTDFGTSDAYAAVLKAVILDQVPDAQIIDITHNVPPHDRRSAAFHLWTSYPYFPANTLFLCVVDPGVGTDRPILFARAADRMFIAPDNGLLSWVFADAPPEFARVLPRKSPDGASVSATFHARDIMGPWAGRILNGADPSGIGQAATSWTEMPLPLVNKSGSRWEAEILTVDRFGNLITNIKTEELEAFAQNAKVWIDLGGGVPALHGLATSYSAVEPGHLLAVPGSLGFIEIAAREANAAELTKRRAGDPVIVSLRV